ncbi:MAG TPA: hypothetical protein QGH10_17785, partial [Armatimonadota bacterium]|nr:hypothetical protein [Armatimonadota bacterium]
LVPCWFLYGVAGFNATAAGLEIRPNLPSDLPWLIVRNVSYRGLTLDIRVANGSVKLTSKTPGHRFTWTRKTRDGAVFTEPPMGIDFPQPESPESMAKTDAAWIWASATAGEHDTVYLRKTVDLPAKPKRATVDIAVDDYWVLFINGQEVAEGQGWSKAQRINVARHLARGCNVIGVKATNETGLAGALVQVTITSGGEEMKVLSGPDWRAANEAPDGWSATDFDDSDWTAATSFGKPPVAPWGHIALP